MKTSSKMESQVTIKKKKKTNLHNDVKIVLDVSSEKKWSTVYIVCYHSCKKKMSGETFNILVCVHLHQASLGPGNNGCLSREVAGGYG